jgi:hypothetical protein
MVEEFSQLQSPKDRDYSYYCSLHSVTTTGLPYPELPEGNLPWGLQLVDNTS